MQLVEFARNAFIFTPDIHLGLKITTKNEIDSYFEENTLDFSSV